MATAPAFASVPRIGNALAHATLDTSLTAPTNVATIITGVAAGTKIEEVIFQAVGTTVAGVINLFIYDGSEYDLLDQFLVPAVTSSTTAKAWRASRQYPNLLLPTASYSLRFTQTIAGNQAMFEGTAFGGDLT